MAPTITFDKTVTIQSTVTQAWRTLKRLASLRASISSQVMDHYIISKLNDATLVYLLEPRNVSDDQIRIRHLVIKGDGATEMLSGAKDIAGLLSSFDRDTAQADTEAQERMKLIENSATPVSNYRKPKDILNDPGMNRPISYLPVAGVGERFFAYFIDGILVNLLLLLISLVLSISDRGALALIALIVTFLYQTLYWTYNQGKTPGKSLLGIRVIQTDGQPVTMGVATGRYFGYFLNNLTFGLGWVYILFDSERRGLHDHIAGTMVVNDVPSLNKENRSTNIYMR